MKIDIEATLCSYQRSVEGNAQCGKDFFSLMLLLKINCRKCGEFVCAVCSKEISGDNRNFAATNGGEGLRKKCASACTVSR